MLKKYKDFIGRGVDHEVTYIDDDWVLKMPRDKSDDGVKYFDEHIKFMQKYPEFFPNVKKLDKYRASVEKMDTRSAKKEIHHLFNFMKYESKEGPMWTIEDLYNHPKDLDILKGGDEICKKWYEFIFKLKSFFPHEGFELHFDQFGLDKQRNIKILDF